MERNWIGTKVRHRHGAVGEIVAAVVDRGNTELSIRTFDGHEDKVILNDAGLDRGTEGWEWFEADGASNGWHDLGDQNRLAGFKVKLSGSEESLLLQFASTHGKTLAKDIHSPPPRTLRSLISKGLVSKIEGREEWRITPAGDVRARSIY